MYKRLFSISTALLLIVLQCGCWNRIELNELSIVSATAVDIKKNGKWEISYQLVIPQAISATTGVSTNVGPVMFSTEGESMRVESIIRARSFLGSLLCHNLMVVVSEEAAKAGIAPLMDVYLRNPDYCETGYRFFNSWPGRVLFLNSWCRWRRFLQPFAAYGPE